MCEAMWPAAQLPIVTQFLRMARPPCIMEIMTSKEQLH